MREYLLWSVPGLMLAGPLQILLGPAMPWPAWLLAAPTIGFALHQGVRWQFEHSGNGFRNPRRGALAAIIERGDLSRRADCGDLAYQVYEIVFYQRPEWEAIRGHAHRCWEWIFLFRSTALGAALGSVFAALAVVASWKFVSLLLLLALPATAYVLAQKARQTESALQLFDRSLVLAHWPMYEAVLRELEADHSR
ncbi:MAG: hypothetical protein HY270_19025 [Deltaproteobacteria bacterium]|nr:hypothetical protein [Deltaproteobacteria bacterium]